jgi:ABC-type transport system involved in multi-copper enzyme maturation permease subunit
MRNAIRSEIRKLLSVRTTYGLLGVAVAIALLTTLSADGNSAAEAAKPLWEQQSWLFTSLLTRLLFVILGIRLVTEEYRYGTLTPSLLATGSRPRLLVAKLLTAAGASVLMAGVAVVTVVAASTMFWAQYGVSFVLTGDDALAMSGMMVAAGLYGALGVGIGAVVRQPVPATVGAVLWLVFGEEVLRTRIGDAVNWLPGHAGLGLAVLPGAEAGQHALVGLALLGWVAAAAAAALVILRRQDVA